MKQSNTPQLVSAEELAKLLGFSTWWVYQETREGRLPCVRFRRAIRFDPHEVMERARRSTERHASTDL